MNIQDKIVRFQEKIYYYKNKIVSRSKNIKLGKRIILNKWTVLEGENRIGDNSDISHTIVGYASYMGLNCKFIRTEIGRFTSIGNNVRIVAGHHPISEYISTSPSFYSVVFGGGHTLVDKEYYQVYKYADPEKELLVTIGNDVWIGEGVRIMEGVKIGDGAVVAAYSVVTKDVEPYGVYGGVPAKLIRYRFEKEWIDKLMKFQWWKKDDEWLKTHVEYFRNPKKFINVMEE